MKKIKKLLALGTLIFFVLGSYTGCSNSSSGSGKTDKDPAEVADDGSGDEDTEDSDDEDGQDEDDSGDDQEEKDKDEESQLPEKPELSDLVPNAQDLGKYIAAEAIEKIDSMEGGNYAIKITGAITAEDIENLNVVMYTKMDRLIALDLRDTTGLTKLDPWAFSSVDKYDDEGGVPLSALILPESITEIDYECFRNCKTIKALIAPGVKILRSYALAQCPELAIMKFSDVMDLLEESSIGWNDAITEITLNAKHIGQRLVPGCEKLTKVIIGPDVEIMEDGPFHEMDKVKEIKVAEGNTHFKDIDGLLYSADGTRFIKFPRAREEKEFTLPDEVTTIDSDAFAYTYLEKVTLPNVSKISDCAFWASSIQEVSIPKTTEIGFGAFYYCTQLNKLSLPDTVTKIKEKAFLHTFNLKSFFIPSTVTTIDYSAFYGWKNDQVINCQAASKPENWDDDWNKSCACQINWGVNPEE